MSERTLTRPAMPWTGRRGDTITVTDDGRIRFNTCLFEGVDALEVSAALAVAVQIVAQRRIDNHTNQTEGA